DVSFIIDVNLVLRV
uniref:Uncharacterized protein n=1 Tax=Myotis lucifugus TaxID=59463 RepID=G1Q4Y6_MYOLU